MVNPPGKRPPWLNNIADRPDAQQLRSKGGKVKSQKKTDANIRIASRIAKCKRCNLNCAFKESLLEQNPEQVCPVPMLRADAKINHTAVVGFDDNKIKIWLSDVIKLFLDLYQNAKTPDDKLKYANKLYNKLLPLKEKYYPATQKNLSLGAQLIKVEIVNPNKKEIQQDVVVIENEKKETQIIE